MATDTNLPVEGATVTIAPKEGGKEKKTKTTKDGLFRFEIFMLAITRSGRSLWFC